MDADTNGQPMLGLAQWLAACGSGPNPMVLVGGTGHLELSPEERRRTAAQIEQDLLPVLAGLPAGTRIVVATGFAPGADLLIGETLRSGLARLGKSCRIAALLPVPRELLWEDWVDRAGRDDAEQLSETRAHFEQAWRECDDRVRLWDPGAAPDWSSPDVRREHYRRLGAVLAQQCDVLIAVLRGSHRGQPGGTAEVVSWRQGRRSVPRALSSGRRRHRRGWPREDLLLLIDPAGPPSKLETARAALRSGNYLLAYDSAMKSRRPGEFSADLEYVKLQALANAGSTRTAMRRLDELPRELRERDEDWLALAGRLHKDLGLRATRGAAAHFRRAADRYRTAFERTGGTFSAINAATTLLLAGDGGEAGRLAHEVLERLGRDGAAATGNERARYYHHATEAEAELLLRRPERARAALERANALLTSDTNARSRTRRQLRRVCEATGADLRTLDALRLPPVIYLGSATPVNPREIPDQALAYAGITLPREIEAAERALEGGARLHVVLAAPPESMLEHWRQLHGADWERRLGALIGAAHERSIALGFLDHEDAWCDAYVGEMTIGLSRLAARRLDCEWKVLGDADYRATGDLVADSPPAPVEASGLRFGRRFAGVIFADFVGFSRLPDAELPVFWAHFMRAIRAALDPLGARVLLRSTWGDALHLVLVDALATAEAACAIQACVEDLRPTLPGALAGLELRLAAHYAPVFSGRDPIEDAETYFGTQLSFTARIEPVTPPGLIFVTEAFAAQLALEAPNRFELEYAGEMRLAKAYGESRLFSLRP